MDETLHEATSSRVTEINRLLPWLLPLLRKISCHLAILEIFGTEPSMTQAVSTVHQVARAILTQHYGDRCRSVCPCVAVNDRTCEHDTIISTIVRSYFVANTCFDAALANDFRMRCVTGKHNRKTTQRMLGRD